MSTVSTVYEHFILQKQNYTWLCIAEMDDIEKELEILERILIDEHAEPTMLSYALLKKITNDFSQEIGSGGFGVVYMV